jgi:hypothetical protein
MADKPKTYNNSWLGIHGVTTSLLVDSNNKELGICLDTPNCIAYAMASNQKVIKAIGRFENKTRNDLQSRFSWILKDKEIHENNIKWYQTEAI